jgi:hypothetical protein
MKSIETLTSRFTPSELYDLTTDTLKNIGSGANNAMLTINEDVISIQNGSIFIETIKEVGNSRYVISEKRLGMYELYQLFELFENTYDNFLDKESLDVD